MSKEQIRQDLKNAIYVSQKVYGDPNIDRKLLLMKIKDFVYSMPHFFVFGKKMQSWKTHQAQDTYRSHFTWYTAFTFCKVKKKNPGYCPDR